MPVPLFLVNAFTTAPFTGNGAAVCLLDEPVDPAWMQRVAAELAQPTTAFTHRGPDGRRHLRWFTPAAELPLCGHATLAAAHVLRESGRALPGAASDEPEPVLSFTTPAGELEVRARAGLLWLDLPAVPLTASAAPPALLGALGVTSDQVLWFGQHGDEEHVAVLDAPERVEQLEPDIDRIRDLPATRTTVTAAGGAGVDITSRVFIPAVGVDEDAVTGSAHAVLGPLWAGRLGRTRLRAAQASARGGELVLEVQRGRVRVGGGAVTVGRGELGVDAPRRRG